MPLRLAVFVQQLAGTGHDVQHGSCVAPIAGHALSLARNRAEALGASRLSSRRGGVSALLITRADGLQQAAQDEPEDDEDKPEAHLVEASAETAEKTPHPEGDARSAEEEGRLSREKTPSLS